MNLLTREAWPPSIWIQQTLPCTVRNPGAQIRHSYPMASVLVIDVLHF